MHPLVRVAVVLTTALAVMGLAIYYGAAVESHRSYPTPTEIQDDYGAYVGEEVFLSGTVVSVSEGANEGAFRTKTEGGSITLRVHPFDVSVRPGGSVQVFGTLESGRSVEATNVVVVNPAGSSDAYKYVVSAIGAGLVVVNFFRHWRIDAASLAFEVRGDG